MMRLMGATLALVAVAWLTVAAGNPQRGVPLWRGARYTREDRDRAIRRGLDFIYNSIARNPQHFAAYGHDLLSAFYNIAVTSRDPELRRMAWRMGHERAVEYRRLHPGVPPGAEEGDVGDLLSGLDAEERLGVPNPPLREQLGRAVARFTVEDFLWFDPRREPPPADIPKACPKCGRQNARGATVCSRDGAPLQMQSRYDIYQDALIGSYTGDRAGITLGAHYRDVLQWLPAMHPYPPRRSNDDAVYYSGVYAVTHVIYTYNDYSEYMVSRACFPEEFEHLKANLRNAIPEKDSETMGEFLDSLRAFGLDVGDDLIRTGFEYLLSVQNPDGSWGDVDDPDPYGRYHPTWTVIDGLRDYRWTRVLPCPAVRK